MINDGVQPNFVTVEDKKTVKRKLARKLIQQIIALYDTIIQKIQHGIGILWEEYISQELYAIAKKKVQAELINDVNQLEDWFENISESIREKFNSLSDNLIAHFNDIILAETRCFDDQVTEGLKFSKEQQLNRKDQKDEEDVQEKKQNSSLYQTCTQSSGEQQKGSNHFKKLCLVCQNHLSQAFGLCSRHQQIHQKQASFSYSRPVTQRTGDDYDVSDLDKKIQYKQQFIRSPDSKSQRQNSKRIRKQVQIQSSEQKEQFFQESFYEVFFGLLQAFQM